MNERIHVLAEEAGLYCDGTPDAWDQEAIERFAQLIAKACADICFEMAAKVAGISDGAGVLGRHISDDCCLAHFAGVLLQDKTACTIPLRVFFRRIK